MAPIVSLTIVLSCLLCSVSCGRAPVESAKFRGRSLRRNVNIFAAKRHRSFTKRQGPYGGNDTDTSGVIYSYQSACLPSGPGLNPVDGNDCLGILYDILVPGTLNQTASSGFDTENDTQQAQYALSPSLDLPFTKQYNSCSLTIDNYRNSGGANSNTTGPPASNVTQQLAPIQAYNAGRVLSEACLGVGNDTSVVNNATTYGGVAVFSEQVTGGDNTNAILLSVSFSAYPSSPATANAVKNATSTLSPPPIPMSDNATDSGTDDSVNNTPGLAGSGP